MSNKIVTIIPLIFTIFLTSCSDDPEETKSKLKEAASIGIDIGFEVAQKIFDYAVEKSPEVKKRLKNFSDKVDRYIEYNGRNLSEEDVVNETPTHEEAFSQVRLKNSDVNVTQIKPQLDSAVLVIANVYWEVLGDDYTPVVTSGNDYHGHKSKSKHYKNAALDFRLKDEQIFKEDRELIVQMVRERLDNRFYVLHESKGTNNEHLHVQYNGK